MRLPTPVMQHRRRVGVVDAREVVDVAVLDEVAAGRERLAVAAGDRPCRRGPASRCRSRAMPWPVPPLDRHAVAAEAPERAAGQQAMVAALDDDAVGAAQFPASALRSVTCETSSICTSGAGEHRNSTAALPGSEGG